MSLLQLEKMESGNWNRAVSFSVQGGEVLLILGRNGAGKTTLLNTIAGMSPIRSGKLIFDGKDITLLCDQSRVENGIHIALEGRKGFSRLTVKKNLLLGAITCHKKEIIENDLEWVISVFPQLEEKLDHLAGTLSGGQQTQLNIGRALMGQPKVLLLDEPALGLDPINARTVADVVRQICTERRITTIIAEQSGQFLQAFPQRVLLMAAGEILFDGSWSALVREKDLVSYLK